MVRSYFKGWIDNDNSIIEKYFSANISYVESWGPAYKGIEEVKLWFENWHVNSKGLIWEIEESIVLEKRIICEWYFKHKHNEDINEFNGVSLIDFDNNNKIIKVKEFMSVLPISYPYGSKVVANGGGSNKD
ncbi:nuclear transport factor 2 family protein [Clostridium gasigenes]|uniref:nuclear transport factor 2 family protein n=1 Tax=Clostridium gasigenes TaxID=94869 RepID=UPI00311A922D